MTEIHSDALSAMAHPEDQYVIHTLIDITDSGAISPKNNYVKFYQAQNLNSFIQMLSLRTQVLSYTVESFRELYDNYGFGNNTTPEGSIWKLTFSTDATLPWLRYDDNLYWLLHDFTGMPVHTKLTESVKITPAIISTLPGASTPINTRFNINSSA